MTRRGREENDYRPIAAVAVAIAIAIAVAVGAKRGGRNERGGSCWGDDNDDDE